MQKIIKFFQFFPVALFLYFSRRNGWDIGFQIGALTALLQFAFLLKMNVPISRLIAGANLFLIFGGVSFYYNIELFLTGLSRFKEAALFISILIITLVATACSKHGAFEKSVGINVKKYSFVFIFVVLLSVVWSLYFRGDGLMAGTIPFVVLIILKLYLEKRLAKKSAQ